MGLYKRGESWCIQYFANGKRIRESIGPSKREAGLVLGKRQATIREGKFFDVRKEAPPIAFSTLADRYLREVAAIRKKPRSYQRNVSSSTVLKQFFNNRPIQTITEEDIHNFIRSRQEQGKASATINAELVHLSHVFTWAMKTLKVIVYDPTKGVAKLKTKIKERYLSHEEIDQLLHACEADIRDMTILALGTGLRASEVLNLTRESIDMKNHQVVLSDTKNGDKRVVPFPTEAREMLARRPLPLREVFPGWTLPRLMKEFRQATQQAGLSGVTFHILRHTFASYAVMSGVDLYTLAKLLGHRDVTMVQRYAHLAPSHLQAAATQAANAIFARQVPHSVAV